MNGNFKGDLGLEVIVVVTTARIWGGLSAQLESLNCILDIGNYITAVIESL